MQIVSIQHVSYPCKLQDFPLAVPYTQTLTLSTYALFAI